MAQIKLGKRPETFKRSVTFPLLEGENGIVECTFRYRTKTEFGRFIDGIFADAGEPAPADGSFSMLRMMETTRDKNAHYLGQVLVGWDLSEKLNSDSLAQFCDELPGGAAAIMEAYREAIVEGRLGN